MESRDILLHTGGDDTTMYEVIGERIVEEEVNKLPDKRTILIIGHSGAGAEEVRKHLFQADMRSSDFIIKTERQATEEELICCKPSGLEGILEYVKVALVRDVDKLKSQIALMELKTEEFYEAERRSDSMFGDVSTKEKKQQQREWRKLHHHRK